MEQEFRLGKQLLEAGHRVRLHIDGLFEDDDLTGLQGRICGFVYRSTREGREIYQKDIEGEFKIGRSSVTSVLNNLEKNGLILRRPAAFDARLKQIVLTEKAMHTSRAHREKLDDFERRLREGLSPQELAVLKKVLGGLDGRLAALKEETR